MKLNGQNNCVSNCIKAAIINILIGCIGGWTVISYFLPGAEKPVYNLVFGIVVAAYFFWLACLNLLQAIRLKQNPDFLNSKQSPHPSYFYFANVLLDILFAFICIAPVITDVLHKSELDSQFYFSNTLSHGLPFFFFLFLAWKNFKKSKTKS